MLAGKICAVTGAGRGIGRHTAEAFAKAGANLLLCARSQDELEKTKNMIEATCGAEVLIEPLDVSNPEETDRFAARAEERYGRVDVLVNNAGVYGPVGPITDVPIKEWTRAIEINLFGVVNAIRAFAPLMIRQGGGRIINLAGGGIGGPNIPTNVSSYTAAKAAVVCLTETLARELSPKQIWINSVAPGAISTRLIDAVIEAGPEYAGLEFYEQSVRQRERGDQIDNVLDLMIFLASERSSNLTGKLLSAKWDDIERLSAESSRLNESSTYSLRRIDGELFVESPK